MKLEYLLPAEMFWNWIYYVSECVWFKCNLEWKDNVFEVFRNTECAKTGNSEEQEKETINIPMWAGVSAVALGGLLLFGGRKP